MLLAPAPDSSAAVTARDVEGSSPGRANGVWYVTTESGSTDSVTSSSVNAPAGPAVIKIIAPVSAAAATRTNRFIWLSFPSPVALRETDGRETLSVVNRIRPVCERLSAREETARAGRLVIDAFAHACPEFGSRARRF